MMNREITDRYQQWLDSPVFDETIKYELSQLTEDEITDRFYRDLEFGTSGMRGVLGAGTNRMNIYLVRRLSYSLGQYIKSADASGPQRGVVIAYDSRRQSIEFALETALVLGALGIRTYVFDELRPTPELSFAVRHLNAIAGVMITASHNPKEYNGYKVYWEDGGQITPDRADAITEILKITGWDIPVITEDTAMESGLLTIVGSLIDAAYLNCIHNEMLSADLTRKHGSELTVVYTPLHGAGRSCVQHMLSSYKLFTVSSQAFPDTEFSTVTSPNPEDSGAWDLSLKLGKAVSADLLLATDPDSDRLGVQCRRADGTYQHFTGNQVGIILLNYILEKLQASGELPEDGVVIHNYVSTAMGRKLADHYGVELRTVPVGFRFAGEQIRRMETEGGTFLFAFEESIGYLKGTYTRDKDAVLAAALAAEAALYYKVNYGKTLADVLDDLYSRFGYYVDQQVSLTLKGQKGSDRIREIMDSLPSKCTTSIACQKIVRCGMDGKLFVMELENGGFVKARPSGTEPKIRFYFCIGGTSEADAKEALEQFKNAIIPAE